MKKLLIPVLTVSLIAGGLYAGSKIMAMGWGMGNNTQTADIAQKLGKTTEEVETAFEQMREEHQAEMQSQFEAKLDEAVQSGELTAEQKQLILAKHEELKAKHEAQQQARQQERAELEAWAEQNGIDTQYLFGMGEGKGMGRGQGGRGMGRGMMAN